MVTTRLYRAEGVVLKSAPTGEGDLVVTLYTQEAGKLRAMAWGARKTTSRKMGHLEPLSRVELALTRGANLDTINQVQGLESFQGLRSSLESISRGFYVAELVDGFGAEGSPNPDMYFLFLDTLRFLDASPDGEMALPFFELHMLKACGFMPELYHCVECRQSLSPGEHRFCVALGGVLCLRCAPSGPRIFPLSLQVLKTLRFLDRNPISSLSGIRFQEPFRGELKGLLGDVTRYWLDREVRAGAFLDHLDRSRKQKPIAREG